MVRVVLPEEWPCNSVLLKVQLLVFASNLEDQRIIHCHLKLAAVLPAIGRETQSQIDHLSNDNNDNNKPRRAKQMQPLDSYY